MAIYLLSYDLVKETSSFDYKPLWAELRRLNAHKTQLSAWLINLTNTPKEVADHFQGFMDNDDRLWVTRVRAAEHWYFNALEGTNDWLKANPPD